MTACICAIVYGLSFDILYKKQINTKNSNYDIYKNETCWNNTLKLRIENLLSEDAFNRKQIERELQNSSSYGGSDSISWLLSILQSLITSLILWQPLTVYIVTWIKIWMFTWNLKMKVGPGNVMALCKKCCCGHSINDDENDNQYDIDNLIDSDNNNIERRHSRKISEVVAHKDRPIDIISFLANDTWIIDDIINDDDKIKHDKSLTVNDEIELENVSKPINDTMNGDKMGEINNLLFNDDDNKNGDNEPTENVNHNQTDQNYAD